MLEGTIPVLLRTAEAIEQPALERNWREEKSSREERLKAKKSLIVLPRTELVVAVPAVENWRPKQESQREWVERSERALS